MQNKKQNKTFCKVIQYTEYSLCLDTQSVKKVCVIIDILWLFKM